MDATTTNKYLLIKTSPQIFLGAFLLTNIFIYGKMCLGQVGVCPNGVRNHTYTPIKAIFISPKAVRLDGGKIKAVCAEKYAALSYTYSSQRPAT